MVHLLTLGAGGGSIAQYDRIHNAVKIGPESAGSDPGPGLLRPRRAASRRSPTPTCCSATSTRTTTPTASSSSTRSVGRSRSRSTLCDELDMDVIEVAKDHQATASTSKWRSASPRSCGSRGYLPEDFTMLAYGGNGPLHACGIADARRHQAHPRAAVRVGVLRLRRRQHEPAAHPRARRPRRDVQRDHPKRCTTTTREFNAIVEELERRGREDLVRQGFEPEDVTLPPRAGHALRQPAASTTAVVFDVNRINGVGDVLQHDPHVPRHLRPALRRGQPGARGGHPGQTIRVAVVRRRRRGEVRHHSSTTDARTHAEPVSRPRTVHFVGHDEPVEHTDLRRRRADTPEHVIARPGDRDHREHHLPGRAGLAPGAHAAGRRVVPARLTRPIAPRRSYPHDCDLRPTEPSADPDRPGASLGRPVHGREPRCSSDRTARSCAIHSITRAPATRTTASRKGVDPLQVDRIRKRLAGALDEGYEMCEQMGAAPGAKWGDLITGDLHRDRATCPTCPVTASSPSRPSCHHPIRYIMKYWKDEPTVGIREGDGFIHNDARYGNIHNTDQ